MLNVFLILRFCSYNWLFLPKYWFLLFILRFIDLTTSKSLILILLHRLDNRPCEYIARIENRLVIVYLLQNWNIKALNLAWILALDLEMFSAVDVLHSLVL